MKTIALAGIAAAIGLGSVTQANALSIDEIYAFGDSLNDCCINPAAPFTNGTETWLPNFSSLIGANYVEATAYNYAIGGAQSGHTNAIQSADTATFMTGLQAQVQRFQTAAPVIGSDDLAVIWVGTNDIWSSAYDQDQLFGVPGLDINKPLGNDPSAEALASYIAGNIQISIGHLSDSGFEQVMVLTPYDIGDAGLFDAVDGPAQNTAYSEALRNKLLTTYTMGIDTYVLDVVELIRDLQAGSPGNGFTQLGTNPSCSFGPIMCEGRLPSEQNEFIYYDFVHLTTATNAEVSTAAASLIDSGTPVARVPLPTTLLLVIGGIGMLSAGRQRRIG